MATTTNYSWTTPDDTALVKDGAAAIRSLGTAIDTTVFNNASAAIAKTIVDAKGDIIAATAADTVARLAVGANDTVLTADSSTATGLKWAASGPAATSYTLLNAGGTALTGATTITVSSLSGYNNLYIIVSGASTGASSTITARFNGDSTNGNYGFVGQYIQNSTSWSASVLGTETTPNYTGIILGITGSADESLSGGLQVDGANSSGVKVVQALGSSAAVNGAWGYNSYARYIGSSVISSFSLISSSTNFDAGTLFIYGAN